MLAYCFNRFQQIAGGIRLHHITSGSRIQRLSHHMWRVMLSDEQNFKISRLPLSLNQPARFQAIHSRHGNIEYHNVRLQTLDLIKGVQSVRCFPYHFPTRPSLQQSPQPLSHNGMIIHQQYADRHKVSWLSEAARYAQAMQISGWLWFHLCPVSAAGPNSCQAETQLPSESPKN